MTTFRVRALPDSMDARKLQRWTGETVVRLKVGYLGIHLAANGIGMVLDGIVAIGRDQLVQSLAHNIGKTVFAADSIAEAVEITCDANPQLAVFDYRFCCEDISEFINAVKKTHLPKIIVVGNNDGNKKTVQNFIDAGADYYLDSTENQTGLEEIVNKIENNSNPESVPEKISQHNDYLFIDSLCESVSMAGKSPAAEHTAKMIKLVAESRCNPVLIIGETGTGKELAARAVHTHRHSDKPFVVVNCAALTANLLESELFGHVKGSFTSADREKTGLLELAGDGAIFLDEISEMPMDLQAKLLRVIQEKTFRKVGGTKEILCKATVIASSNRNLRIESEANRFRSDLYHRLNIFPIALSPLRKPQRKDDIKLIAEHFLQFSTICPEKIGTIKSITPMAIEALEKYNWPGNIRELKNVIDRAVILETRDKIGLSSIVINTEEPHHFADDTRIESTKDFSLAKAEQELIARALQETKWQKTKAAELLGISRATLYAKVKQHSIADEPELLSDSQQPSELTESAVA